MSGKVKVTYASRRGRKYISSSSPSTIASSPSPQRLSRKRPVEETQNTPLAPPNKKRAQSNNKPTLKQKSLIQLHLAIDTTVLRTCSTCGLSYTKGAPDDESLHRAHCARVQRGMEWGREEEREKLKAGVTQIRDGIKLKDGKTGRIVAFRADVGGKLGAKLSVLLETINVALSSPALTPVILRDSKAYLFLVPSPASSREKIVGCVIAQRIKAAMTVVSDQATTRDDKVAGVPPPVLVQIDASSSLYCYPEPLPTPLGIPRLFVSSTHRRQGIATHLLSAAAETSIHGCRLDPRKGHVAFTQPTGLGLQVMKKWGGSGFRIYEE